MYFNYMKSEDFIHYIDYVFMYSKCVREAFQKTRFGRQFYISISLALDNKVQSANRSTSMKP